MRLIEKNSRPNRRAFCSQKARHPELEKRLCDYVDDKRQYGCTITSEICQIEALAVSKELGITGFKGTLHLCQEAPGKRVPTASSGYQRGVATVNHAQHPQIALASTCVRLTVVTMYVEIDAFLQANLYFS